MQREVPRHDGADHPERLAHDHHHGRGIRRGDLVIDLVAGLAVVGDALGRRGCRHAAHRGSACPCRASRASASSSACSSISSASRVSTFFRCLGAASRQTPDSNAALCPGDGAVDVLDVAGGDLCDLGAGRRVDAGRSRRSRRRRSRPSIQACVRISSSSARRRTSRVSGVSRSVIVVVISGVLRDCVRTAGEPGVHEQNCTRALASPEPVECRLDTVERPDVSHDAAQVYLAREGELRELGKLRSYYGRIHAVKGISLTVREGEVVTLIGSNGAGKSTTLRTINGLVHAREGTIRFQGEDITRMAPHHVVANGISQSPEGRHVFPRMTVLENLEMGAYQRPKGSDVQEDLDRVYALFPRLDERKTQKAGTLSGGEQQMLAMGRALMARPKLLLLDEPSMGLAPIFVERIFEIIVEINTQGTPVLLVEQNALMALEVADRGYVLETGHIVLEGAAKELATNEQVRKTYLGET